MPCVPLFARGGTGGPDRALTAGQGLAVSGDGVVFSGLRHVGGELEVRLVAYRDEPASAVLSLPGLRAAVRTDLAGDPLGELAVSGEDCAVELRPWEIGTVRLTR